MEQFGRPHQMLLNSEENLRHIHLIQNLIKVYKGHMGVDSQIVTAFTHEPNGLSLILTLGRLLFLNINFGGY